jgi:hypothetical protein
MDENGRKRATTTMTESEILCNHKNGYSENDILLTIITVNLMHHKYRISLYHLLFLLVESNASLVSHLQHGLNCGTDLYCGTLLLQGLETKK